MTSKNRYIVRDVRKSQSQDLARKISTPWQIIDTETQTIVDEFHSYRAAKGTASDMNRDSAEEKQ